MFEKVYLRTGDSALKLGSARCGAGTLRLYNRSGDFDRGRIVTLDVELCRSML